MKRRSSAGVDGGAGGAASGFGFQAEHPSIYDYLASPTFDDGSERETATLLIFCASGLWKACLNDRQEGVSCWVTASTYSEVLEALEVVLASGTAEWRSSGIRKKK